jgi:hypothetical protein
MTTQTPDNGRETPNLRRAMYDTDSALVLRNGPVLAPVWVQEDEYSYNLHINLVCNGVEHGLSLIVWKGVNAHHAPSVVFARGNDEAEFTWVSKNDGSPIPLDAFRQWVTEATGGR